MNIGVTFNLNPLEQGGPGLNATESKPFIPQSVLNDFSYQVFSKSSLQTREFDERIQFEEILSLAPPLFAKEFWLISDVAIQFHLVEELVGKGNFLEYWEEIQKTCEQELEELQGDSCSFVPLPYQMILELLDERDSQKFLGLLSHLCLNKASAEKANLIYKRLFVNIETSFSLKHLIGKDVVERMFAKCEVAEDLDESEAAMKQELASLSKNSIFKQYLINTGALDKKGQLPSEHGFSQARQNIQYALQVLARVLGVRLENEHTYDLKTWNEKTSEQLYSRFLKALEEGNYDPTVKAKFQKIIKSKNDNEKKVEDALNQLGTLVGVRGIHKLQDSFSIKIGEKDLGDFPGIQLDWDPNKPLLEQRDEGFKALCLSTLVEANQKRGIEIDLRAHYLAGERGDFSGLAGVLSKMPKLGERIRSKILDLCREVRLSAPSDISTYDLYCLFKKASEDYNKRAEEIPPIVTTGLVIEEQASSSPTATTEETSSVTTDIPSPKKPEAHFIETLTSVKDWVDQNGTSVFSHFVFQKRLFACQGEEFQLLEIVHVALETYVDALKLESEMLKEVWSDDIRNLDELDALSNTLSYKKFLKGVAVAKKKNEDSAILKELQEISTQDRSTKEKRALSLQKLDEAPSEPHLEKLKQCLISLFSVEPSQALGKIELEYKAKKAAFKWLSESSFLKSLETPIGTKNSPEITEALLSLRKKTEKQIEKFNMPSIYLDALKYLMKKGDVDGLKQFVAEIAYQRYVHAVNLMECEGKQELVRLGAEAVTNISIFERIKKCKEHATTAIKDREILNYLLFQLKQLAYNPRRLSEKSKDVICAYLLEKNASRPLDQYLEEMGFSWRGHGEEPCDWFAYLYEEFVQQITADAKKSKYTTTQQLVLELENLDPFDFPKLNQLAECIRSPKTITVQDLYKFGFVRSVEKALKSRQNQEKHRSNFEATEDLSAQVALLDSLSRNLELSYLVRSTIKEGSPRSLDVGYEFLKDAMDQLNKEALNSFLGVHFFGYSDHVLGIVAKEAEVETQQLKELESLMQGELAQSKLRRVLEEDYVLDAEGCCTGLVALMPRYKLEPYIRSIKAFVEVNNKKEGASPYSHPNSWVEDLQGLNQLLEGAENLEDFTTCFPEQVDNLMKDVLDLPKEAGSFSAALCSLGVEQLQEMYADEYYQQYLCWEGKVYKYFEEKLAGLEQKKEALLDSCRDDEEARRRPAFQYILSVVYNKDLATNLIEDLKKGIEKRDWEAVNERAGQIIYMEYRMTLINLIISRGKTNSLATLKNVLASQLREIEGRSSRQRIEDALNNPLTSIPHEDQAQLRRILNNENWIEKQESCIRSQWRWAQTKQYLRGFYDIQVDPNKLTIFEKKAILDNIFSSLGAVLLREVEIFEMDEKYKELIKSAYYEECLFLWDWVVEEVSYEKYLSMILEAQDLGEDMSMFNDLEQRIQNCTIYEKTRLIHQTLEESQSPACKAILDDVNKNGFFKIDIKALCAQEL